MEISNCDLDGDVTPTAHDIEEGEEQAIVQSLPSPLQVGPKKKPSAARLSTILFDQGLFTMYKRLFLLSFILNITVVILGATGVLTYAREKAVMFCIGNVVALTLCRSEVFLRVIFWLAVNCLGWPFVPIQIKTIVTSLLQSLGGIHSGCAVSSIAWLVYALVLTLNDIENTSAEIIGVAIAILSILCFSSVAAFPLIRHLHHNIFERVHRFFGWAALVLVWAFIVLKVSYNPQTKSYNSKIGSELVKHPEFWFTLSITLLIAIPWVTVRRVPVNITAPSGHASVIKFDGGIKPGLFGRISPSPLSEWHAFGIISDGKKEHMMLAAAVGDFTQSLVTNPPSHLWVRKVHFAGLPYLVDMYSKVLLVATGSGISVFLSFLLQPSSADVRFLWITKGVEENFGKEIKEMISGHSEEKVIVHDSSVLGRPNVSKMSVETAKKWGVEIVIVTSNPDGSRDVVRACEKAGIPAFGPIWDS